MFADETLLALSLIAQAIGLGLTVLILLVFLGHIAARFIGIRFL